MACGGRGSLPLLLLLLLLGLEAWISEPGLELGAECGSGSGVGEGAEGLDWRDGGMEGKHGKVKKRQERALGRKGEHLARVRGELYEGGVRG